MNSRSARFQELKGLLDQGHISQPEYERLRAALLSDLGEGSAAPAVRGTSTALMAGDDVGPADDKYELVRPLGVGGMSQVWLARGRKAERMLGSAAPVRALKLLRSGASEEESELFKSEAFRTQALSHPNIVRAYNLLEDHETRDETILIQVMEYIEDGSLRDRVKRGRHPAQWKDVLALLRPVAQALQYAWEKHKLVHRDLKPENVMFDSAGEVKLVDFGVAAQVRSDKSRLGRNASDGSGTSSYLAPEALMIRGHAQPTLDVYSLAVMAYELLSSDMPADQRLPYDGWPSAHSRPRKPTGLDEAQWQALQSGLRVDPSDRAPTAWEWVRLCEEAGTSGAPTALSAMGNPAEVTGAGPKRSNPDRAGTTTSLASAGTHRAEDTDLSARTESLGASFPAGASAGPARASSDPNVTSVGRQAPASAPVESQMSDQRSQAAIAPSVTVGSSPWAKVIVATGGVLLLAGLVFWAGRGSVDSVGQMSTPTQTVSVAPTPSPGSTTSQPRLPVPQGDGGAAGPAPTKPVSSKPPAGDAVPKSEPEVPRPKPKPAEQAPPWRPYLDLAQLPPGKSVVMAAQGPDDLIARTRQHLPPSRLRVVLPRFFDEGLFDQVMAGDGAPVARLGAEDRISALHLLRISEPSVSKPDRELQGFISARAVLSYRLVDPGTGGTVRKAEIRLVGRGFSPEKALDDLLNDIDRNASQLH